MSPQPTSFRLPLHIEGKAEPEVVEAMQYHDDAINDLQQAIPSLKSQITALKSAASTASSTTTQNVSTASETTIIQPEIVGTVNNQTGNTAYATQQSDYGALIVFNDAAAVAVALTTGTGIQLPWFCWITNRGAGTATLTPATGTINGAGTFTLLQNQACGLYYDGTNFWAVLIPAAPSGLSITIVTAALTTGGTQGSMTFVNGLLESQTPAT